MKAMLARLLESPIIFYIIHFKRLYLKFESYDLNISWSTATHQFRAILPGFESRPWGFFFTTPFFEGRFLFVLLLVSFFSFPLIYFCFSYFLFSFFLPIFLIFCLLFLHFYFSSLLFFSHLCILLSLISSSLFSFYSSPCYSLLLRLPYFSSPLFLILISLLLFSVPVFSLFFSTSLLCYCLSLPLLSFISVSLSSNFHFLFCVDPSFFCCSFSPISILFLFCWLSCLLSLFS